ncbi:hypothetical protein NDU88_006738 [Pleurodeles waltl]|uniref:Uncharacterized protein n=1 Tax=Pleurodeles waltl TaxID=8319 RepID=A0AAV7MI85_PLEWA|nr:hypothetical protein NDU88_006738 [Pleurodeles waltl]
MGERPSPTGCSGFSGQGPRHSPVVLGPRVSPQAPHPSAPRSEWPPGESPSRGPGRLSRRSAAPPRLWGRTTLSPLELRSPDPAAAGREGTPGEPHESGGASRLPPDGPQGSLMG